MSLPHVRIAAPVRNRAWILPRYLDALERLDYPPDRLSFHFLVNDSADESESVLSAWEMVTTRAYREIRIERMDFGRTEVDTDGAMRLAGPRRAAYPYLARMRQHLFNAIGLAEYLFSVDTDVLVRSDTLMRLLSHRVAVVAALVRNGPGAYNFLQETGDRYERPSAPPPLRRFEVALTGACCLYSRRAVQAGRWSAGATGEDEGLARSLAAAGIPMWVDGTLEVQHLMEGPKHAGAV